MNIREKGILRKNQSHVNHESLIIVGYQSRIFDDQEKALFIDQGQHLIKWMDTMIDRYDVRATIMENVAEYEAPIGGYSNRLDYLTPAEQQAEKLCEEERYYSLYHNDLEEEAYQEEANKRQGSHGQIPLQYDTLQPGPLPPSHIDDIEGSQEPDDPFEPLPNFEIPRHVDVPDTMRLNAIIEKTARFIAKQGAQMEILIKAKQSKNPQFDFLNMNGRYSAYYKLLVSAMKDGKYPDRIETLPKVAESRPTAQRTSKRSNNTISAADPLTGSASIALVKYVPSEDCAYTQLISKIKGKPISQIKFQDPPEERKERPPIKSQPTRQTLEIKSNDVELKSISSGLLLAQCYNTDTESDQEEDDEAVLSGERNSCQQLIPMETPPPDIISIVDKTAAYVAKNGNDFEKILRSKNDPRFSFLNPSDVYNAYYKKKVAPSQDNTQENVTLYTQPQPLSFKIRSQKMGSGEAESTKLLQNAEPFDHGGGDSRDLGKDKPNESVSVDDMLELEERKDVRRPSEKELQQERKRKAMEFVKKIRGAVAVSDSQKGKEIREAEVKIDLTSDDGESIERDRRNRRSLDRSRIRSRSRSRSRHKSRVSADESRERRRRGQTTRTTYVCRKSSSSSPEAAARGGSTRRKKTHRSRSGDR